MRFAVAEQSERVLRASARERSERTVDAAAGRAVHGASVFGLSQAGEAAATRGARHQPQARAAADAAVGSASDLPEAGYEQAASEASDLPVFAEESDDHGAEPSVGDRHHLHPAGARVLLSGGGNRLVQPLRRELAFVGDDGERLLRGDFERSADQGNAHDLQHRSRQPVHQLRVHGSTARGGRAHQHGRARQLSRQHLHRAFLALREV